MLIEVFRMGSYVVEHLFTKSVFLRNSFIPLNPPKHASTALATESLYTIAWWTYVTWTSKNISL